MTSNTTSDLQDYAQQLLECAKAAGAEAADTVLISGESNHASVRDGSVEDIERAETRDLGLRVFIGQAQAVVSASRFEPAEFSTLAERAVAMARVSPPDPMSGLAADTDLAAGTADFDIADDEDPVMEDLVALALRAEQAGRSVEGVSKSSGAGARSSRRHVMLAATNGFSGCYVRTQYSFSAAMIAGTGTGMESDYDYSAASHFQDLETPETIGRSAGERAVRHLNPRKVTSKQVPVIYEQRLASSLMSHLASAVNGSAVARGTSFLKDRMNTGVFKAGITVTDDATLPRGMSSRPFDGEGLPGNALTVIASGELKSWLLDTRSARQLGLASTGNAARSTHGPPQPASTNFNLAPGEISAKDLIANVRDGFFVTGLIGMGVNAVTGDYSRGASGFWIENGEIAYPVSEVTVAGNLVEMFARLTPADDLLLRGSTNAPTCLIEGMTVAGA